jgi:hypothetical protein
MIKQLVTRLLYGLLFAIPLMLISSVLVKANAEPSMIAVNYRSEIYPAVNNLPGNIPAVNNPDCGSCHKASEMAWENGAHGKATTDPVFKEAWEDQGEPKECLACHVTGYDPETNTWQSEGITCVSCHNPVTVNHPLAPMTIPKSAETCGKCHTQAYFAWQVSNHGQEGIDCESCHDPHGTDLKIEGVLNLCASCHSSRVNDFTHTQHSQRGLTCVNCHLQATNSSIGGGAARLDHSFSVSLMTCNGCHVTDMHKGVVEGLQHAPTPTPDAMMSAGAVQVTEEPQPVNQMGFTTLAGLAGLVLGIIIAPWVGRIQRRHGLFINGRGEK